MKVEDVPLPGFRFHPTDEDLRRRQPPRPALGQYTPLTPAKQEEHAIEANKQLKGPRLRTHSKRVEKPAFGHRRPPDAVVEGSIGTALDRIGLPDRGFGKQRGFIELFIHIEDNHTDTIQKAEQQGVNQINGIRQLYRNVAAAEQLNSIAQPPLFASSSSFSNQESDFFTVANWDELRSVVEFADIDPFLL
ncbi:hypothetical protein J1N35_028721 [Gossypium stocksii]|uniref:Uncharacterized protein n=1 Tax=Gossypium stocksii TaxID=47602 RepID=A0A9D3UX99_9ROSI|nr:hypothetical protein J1N35_028721 [Gossypium stocksii]